MYHLCFILAVYSAFVITFGVRYLLIVYLDMYHLCFILAVYSAFVITFGVRYLLIVY